MMRCIFQKLFAAPSNRLSDSRIYTRNRSPSPDLETSHFIRPLNPTSKPYSAAAAAAAAAGTAIMSLLLRSRLLPSLTRATRRYTTAPRDPRLAAAAADPRFAAVDPASSEPRPAVADGVDPPSEGSDRRSEGGDARFEGDAPPSGGGRKGWGFLGTAAFAALAAALGATAYVSYAYTLDEVDQNTSALRTMSDYSVDYDASTLEELKASVYSSAIKIPIKTVELYMDMRRAIEDQVRGFAEPISEKLLPDLPPEMNNVFTLVLDLNETLVYSDWKRERGWRTFKRPGVDAFLEHMAKFYEIVIYTDQLDTYAAPVIDRLDQKGYIPYRLARAATKYVNGNHYRDLSKLNRDPSRILYVSGHAAESCLQPENSVPVKPWKLEPEDTALLDLIPFLEYVALHRPADIRPVLASYHDRDIAQEFIERSKDYQRRMQAQKQNRGFWRQ